MNIKWRILIRNKMCFVVSDEETFIIKPMGKNEEMYTMHIEQYDGNLLTSNKGYENLIYEWDDMTFKIDTLTIYIVYWGEDIINWVIDAENIIEEE